QLAGIDEVALGLDGIILDIRSDHAVRQLGIVDAVAVALNVAGEVLADEAVEQGVEHVLLEIPAVDRAAYVIGDLPNLSLQGRALLGAGHRVVPVSIYLVWRKHEA